MTVWVWIDNALIARLKHVVYLTHTTCLAQAILADFGKETQLVSGINVKTVISIF